ncbi:MAG TPA: hypothetical protein VFO94_05605, partial [Gammaproteobacteria bacterium]|nr:hypothetical protein [Gammaproteobacteria bacterium]
MLVPRDSHLDKAWGIVYQLLHGRLTLDDLARQVEDARLPALQARVDGLLRQLASHDEQDNEARLRALLVELAQEDGARVPFARFAQLVGSELAGIVLTAHPTFSLSAEAYALALELVRAGAAGPRRETGVSPGVRQIAAPVRRLAPPTLKDELELSMAALEQLRKAIRRVLRVVLDVGAELYPREYRALRPQLVTVATWVGFDVDGRTDIGWSKSLSCRYELALAGLAELRASLAEIGERHSNLAPDAAAALDAIRANLDVFAECFEIGMQALGREAEDSTRLGKLNRLALEKRPLKQDALASIDGALGALLAAAHSDALAKDAIVLRAEWELLGLGLARLHFRLNSVQLHNAIRPEIALAAQPGQSQSRRHFLAEVSRLLDGVTPVNVHYGTVAREQTTAKRVLMLAAQFHKHFDGRTPM